MKIVINLFGIGCAIIKGQFDDKTWTEFQVQSKALGASFQNSIFDPSFYDMLNKIWFNSWTDLGNQNKISGLLYDEQSIIEIRINSMQGRKINFKQLFNEEVLFPVFKTTIYKTEISCNQHNTIIALEKEKGTIASYKIECFDFSLEKLEFNVNKVHLINSSIFYILTNIFYDSRELKKIYSDTVVVERYGL